MILPHCSLLLALFLSANFGGNAEAAVAQKRFIAKSQSMPKLTGLTEDQARTLLGRTTAKGVQARQIPCSSANMRGKILSTVPPAGYSLADREEPVHLTLCK